MPTPDTQLKVTRIFYLLTISIFSAPINIILYFISLNYTIDNHSMNIFGVLMTVNCSVQIGIIYFAIKKLLQ